MIRQFGAEPGQPKSEKTMAKKLRLSQVIAVEKQVKSKVNSEGAELHKSNQKPDCGIWATYQ